MNTSYRDFQRLFPHRGSALSYAMLAALLLLLPLTAGQYLLTQATFVFINGTVALGLMLLVGYTGLISLGHVAFFAVGAYTVTVLELNGVAFVPALASAIFRGSGSLVKTSNSSRQGWSEVQAEMLKRSR